MFRLSVSFEWGKKYENEVRRGPVFLNFVVVRYMKRYIQTKKDSPATQLKQSSLIWRLPSMG